MFRFPIFVLVLNSKKLGKNQTIFMYLQKSQYFLACLWVKIIFGWQFASIWFVLSAYCLCLCLNVFRSSNSIFDLVITRWIGRLAVKRMIEVKTKHPNKVYCQQNISKKTFEKILWKEQIKFRKKYWISIESNQELKQTTEKRRWKVVKMSTMSATFQAKFIGLVFCFHFFLSICIVDKI